MYLIVRTQAAILADKYLPPFGSVEPTDADIEDMCHSRRKQELRDWVRECGSLARVKIEIGGVLGECGLQVIRAAHQQFRLPA